LLTVHLISPAFAALIQVILIDIAMAGDNAVVIGLAATRVPKPQRRQVIFWGLVAAVILRLALAMLTVNILDNMWFKFAGGILLLCVAWRLYRDLDHSREERVGAKVVANKPAGDVLCAPAPKPDLRRAILRIAAADLSMSLDNVLAISGAAMNAGAAINRFWVLGVGLMLSVALMGFAASLVAKLLQRHPWINYAALIIVLYVALYQMIRVGGMEIYHAALPSRQAQQQRARVVTIFEAPVFGIVRSSGREQFAA
jgi:YjbE family integral membrane protein